MYATQFREAPTSLMYWSVGWFDLQKIPFKQLILYLIESEKLSSKKLNKKLELKIVWIHLYSKNVKI